MTGPWLAALIGPAVAASIVGGILLVATKLRLPLGWRLPWRCAATSRRLPCKRVSEHRTCLDRLEWRTICWHGCGYASAWDDGRIGPEDYYY